MAFEKNKAGDYQIVFERTDGTKQVVGHVSEADLVEAGIRPAVPVSDAVLDEVFEKHADPHMRSVHGLDESTTPALSSEQIAQLIVQPSEDEKFMQQVNEMQNGFPSNFMAAERDELKKALDFARDYWAENPHPLQSMPSMETPSEDEVDYRPAVKANRVLRFAAMADRAEAAARGEKTERTMETTSEQGA